MSKVMVGMSGGVDSSAVVCLLKESGYETAGATLKMFVPRFDDPKPLNDDIADARAVAEMLGIEHFVIEKDGKFEKTVIKNFIETYMRGETPNPCVFCNRNMKFPEMLAFAQSKGFDFIATGHYANIEKSNGRNLLKKAKDVTKDQTYMLCALTQDILGKTLFPLGNMTKKEIREYAAGCGIPVAAKKDSQDICFIKDGDYFGFISRRAEVKAQTGNFCDMNGKVIGTHKGITAYTVGQRKGLGISSQEPYYVVSKNVSDNTVVLGREADLYSKTVKIRNVNFIPFDKLERSMKADAKLRYSQKVSKCTVFPDENGCVLEFDEPQRAVTPGQYAVLYDGEYVVGGGIIC